MKKRILYTMAGVACALSFNSCGLDEYNPSAGDATIENYDTWAGLQTSCYSTLYHELYSKQDFLLISDGGTDLWLASPNDKDWGKNVLYYESLSPGGNEPKKVWNQSYSVIATCNSVINNAGSVSGGDADDIKVLSAEAKVIRAFMHLTLATYFGPIPLCTNEVGLVDKNPVRNTLQEVYNSITTDLKEAANDLGVEPYDGNYARVTKKTALGLLARAYAQGAAEGLTENGVSYWQRAKEVSEDMIANASSYGMYLYDDVSDLWAQSNNRKNKEALFIAAGLDANGTDASMASQYAHANCYLYALCMANPNSCQDLYKVKKVDNYYYGSHNQSGVLAPTKYAIDVFGDWDKRYENTFLTAYGSFTVEGKTGMGSTNRRLKLTPTLCKKYGISEDFIGETIYPYAALEQSESPLGTQSYAKGIYKKDDPTQTEATKNALVVEQPLAEDESRILIYLSKKDLTAEEKAKRRYFCMNISDLFESDGGEYSQELYKPNGTTATYARKVYPSLIKYNFLYDGATYVATHPYRNGDIFIMRSAEIYLIAAEANVMLGNSSAATQYLKPLRDRACRTGYTVPTLSNPTEQDIVDEYAREFAGEHMRWAVLKRHRANGLMKSALQKYNKRAYASFDESIHYCRPIPQEFLDQISNAEEFGDNGYGYTANKGY